MDKGIGDKEFSLQEALNCQDRASFLYLLICCWLNLNNGDNGAEEEALNAQEELLNALDEAFDAAVEQGLIVLEEGLNEEEESIDTDSIWDAFNVITDGQPSEANVQEVIDGMGRFPEKLRTETYTQVLVELNELLQKIVSSENLTEAVAKLHGRREAMNNLLFTVALEEYASRDDGVAAPAGGGVAAPAEGGVAAPAEGGIAAPAEGGIAAPTEGGGGDDDGNAA